MGYTNYWKPKKLDMKDIPSQFWEDAAEVLDMVISKGVILAGVHGDTRLSCGKEIIENSKQYKNKKEAHAYSSMVTVILKVMMTLMKPSGYASMVPGTSARRQDFLMIWQSNASLC